MSDTTREIIPSLALRFRRARRTFLSHPRPFQAASIATVMVLVAGLLTAAVGVGSDDGGSITGATGAGDDRVAASPDGTTSDSDDADGPGSSAPGSSPASPGAAVPGEPTPPGTNPGGGGGGGAGTAPASEPGACGDGPLTPSQGKRTASDRGVSPTHVKVVFPVFDPSASFKVVGAGADIEAAEDMIRACVDHVNAAGGIDGRRIDPIIQVFNPLDSTAMRAQCIKWATDDKVFAMVDSDAWHTEGQLCLTEEHDTPLISRWTTASEWTRRGAPYLWWMAPSADDVIADWVLWAREAGHLGGSNVVGVAISDRASDNFARPLIEAALDRAGVNAKIEVIPYDNARAQAALPGAIQRMKAAKVNRLFMMLPFTTYGFWLNHAGEQEYFPRYLISDYEAVTVVTFALLAAQHPKALHDAVGPTHIEMGVPDRLENFRAASRRCNDIFMAAHTDHEPGKIQIAGVGMRWCDNITVFVEAARGASVAQNGQLTRDGFARAMGSLRNFPGRMTPQLTFGPGDYSGPSQSKAIRIATRDCPPELDDVDPSARDGICAVEIQPYQPMRRF